MKLLLQDFSGHPCQVHLSRLLAADHEVLYVYCSDYESGQGRTEKESTDPASLTMTGISLGGAFEKTSLVGRIRQEIFYAARLLRHVRDYRPDKAILSNTPLLSLGIVCLVLKLKKIPYVFWQQDIYSEAIKNETLKRGPLLRFLGRRAIALEGWVARSALCVIPISAGFLPILHSWRVDRAKIFVIPNWAPISEIPLQVAPTPWKIQEGFADRRLVIYSGTIGLKHSQQTLLTVAQALLLVDPTALLLVVTSQTAGKDLQDLARHAQVQNLQTMKFLPYSLLPELLGSADALLVVLEGDASSYSVPSKVLAYLCAGRPILAVMPADNDASKVLLSTGAGLIMDNSSDSIEASIRAAFAPNQGESMGHSGRTYAEKTFADHAISQLFNEALALT